MGNIDLTGTMVMAFIGVAALVILFWLGIIGIVLGLVWLLAPHIGYVPDYNWWLSWFGIPWSVLLFGSIGYFFYSLKR